MTRDKMVSVTFQGQTFEIEQDSAFYRRLERSADDAAEAASAELTEKGMQVIKKAMRDAYLSLDIELQDAMNGKAIVGRLANRKFTEISTYLSKKVMIKQAPGRKAPIAEK